MAIPSTKATLKSYCLRALGDGVIDINVSDDQADDRLDEALQYFAQYHYDGIERMYLKHQITQAELDRGIENTTTAATDKVDTEVPSPFNGTVTSLLVEEGETVEVGASLLELDGSTKESSEDKFETFEEVQETVEEVIEEDKTNKDILPKTDNSKNKKKLKLSPVVRRLAAENNIDLENVVGTGQNGRINREDIENYIASGDEISATSTEKGSTNKKVTSQSPDINNSISRLRKRIAENMVLSKQTSAHE